jgi:hypothetical protein
MTSTFLTSTHTNTHAHAITTPALIAAPNGSHVISHLRKDTSSQLTYYVISVENYHSHAMLATTDAPIKIYLPTSIIIAGSHHQQIVYIQFNPIDRSILGRAYTNLFQTTLTQTMDPTIPIPQVHPTKGLTGRRSKKMAWATTMLQDPDTYKEYAKELSYEVDESRSDSSNPINLRRAQPRATPRRTNKNTQRNRRPPHDPTQTQSGAANMDIDQDTQKQDTL